MLNGKISLRKANSSSMAIDSASKQSKSLPAIPVLQQVANEEEKENRGPVAANYIGGQHDQAELKENKTGMPDNLKKGVENLSGIDISDVKVHYNSSQPAQLSALAYAQGENIHIGPGQEKHLPHEAWHVVQQRQNRVQPTKQMKQGMALNNDRILENEADVMGAKALSGHNINVAQRVVQLEGEPVITSLTTLAAPDGSVNTRTTVGVGEKVTFTGSAVGNWTATGGTPLITNNSDTYVWTAPNRAAAVAIKLAVADKESSVLFNIVEPTTVTGTKNSEVAYAEGTPGAGMTLTFTYGPLNVSFGNIEVKEVSGPASNVTGWYQDKISMDELFHDSGDLFTRVGEDNEDTAEDEAYAEENPANAPYYAGTYDWVIPNHFEVVGDGGDKKFAEVTQAHAMLDDTGRMKITKAGAEVERTP